MKNIILYTTFRGRRPYLIAKPAAYNLNRRRRASERQLVPRVPPPRLDNNIGILGLAVLGLSVSVLGLSVPERFGFISRVYYSTGKGNKLDRVNFVKLYLDANIHKLDILKENEGKSGIYL